MFNDWLLWFALGNITGSTVIMGVVYYWLWKKKQEAEQMMNDLNDMMKVED